MVPRRLPLLLPAAALALLATAGPASAATYPTVKSIKPLEAKIGQRLTITGTGFRTGKYRTTVVLKARGGRAVFVRAESATTSRLVVKLPSKLLSFLRQGQPTRFQVRILAVRFSKTYTPLAASPRIAAATTTGSLPVGAPPITATPISTVTGGTAPATAPTTPVGGGSGSPAVDTDGDGFPDSVDTDDDNDLLTDNLEVQIHTNPLNPDTDRDGVSDGFEFKSALDLDQRSCPNVGDYPAPCAATTPYPAKRPYPNPLYADAGTDYDGDSLTLGEEYAAWARKGDLEPQWRTLTNMWYSDGLQASQDTAAQAGCRGMAVPPPFDGVGTRPEFGRGTTPETYPTDLTQPQYAVYSLDNVGRHAGDGCLDDGERDEDGDFLSNFVEAHGPMTGPSYFQKVFGDPGFLPVTYQGTDWLNPDTDGNGIVDGLDDNDHDDFLNIEEIVRGTPARNTKNEDTGVRSGLWVDPYNPCLPNVDSRTCPTTQWVDSSWRPFGTAAGDPPPPQRWPLYGPALIWNPIDKGDDPDGDGPLQAPADITPPESWTAPSGVDQTQNPPLHPLPR